MAHQIHIESLTSDSFSPFGEVLVPPAQHGRTYFETSLRNDRPHVGTSLSLCRVEVAKKLPINASQMERHEKSSQSFIPLGEASFLILVAPHAPGGGPDMTRARAFIAEGGVGVTYGANVWHHPLSVLQTPATFAVLMWRDGSPEDEEFVDIDPVMIIGTKVFK